MFLLDTNVISELRKAQSGKADPKVVAWASRFSVSNFYLSAITILELEMGVLQIERKDEMQGVVLRAWLNTQVIPAFAERVLPVDMAVAQTCAALHVPDPGSERDTLIAATAMVHGMTVATRNIDDFVATGVDLLNPWDLACC